MLLYLEIEPEFELTVGGIHPDERCKVKTKVAKLNFKIIDDLDQESKELSAWFAFHPFPQRTSLLGMKDIIEKLDFHHKSDQDKLILSIP